MEKHRRTTWSIILVIAVLSALCIPYLARAIPSGASITYMYNYSSNGSAAGYRNDSGGYIYAVTVSSVQQDYNWKAYVGNVTGSYTLDDAQGSTIYNWPGQDQDSGEVYVSRGSAVNWDAINCSTYANLTAENAEFGFYAGSTDSVNATFNNSLHPEFTVGTRTITANTCYSTQLFQNDTRPDSAAPTHDYWQEIMLQDNISVIYATQIQANRHGFNENLTDFQIIVPENSTSDNHRYYFWVEI